MRVVIVDDEPLARERLCALIAELPGYEVAGEAADGEAALALIEQEEPDVVLLDIRMGGALDGLQVSKALSSAEMPPAIIITTAYPEHALSAFGAKAAGYLLKPVRLDILRNTLQQTCKLSRAQVPSLIGTQDQHLRRDAVIANTRDGVIRIPAQGILYFSADEKYTTVTHIHGENLIEESLRTLEADFSPQFLRIHRKYLVAIHYITALVRTRGDEPQFWLRLRHVMNPLPVSRRRLREVRRVLNSNG